MVRDLVLLILVDDPRVCIIGSLVGLFCEIPCRLSFVKWNVLGLEAEFLSVPGSPRAFVLLGDGSRLLRILLHEEEQLLVSAMLHAIHLKGIPSLTLLEEGLNVAVSHTVCY